MIIFNCSFLSYLTFILLFFFHLLLFWYWNLRVEDKVNKVVVVVVVINYACCWGELKLRAQSKCWRGQCVPVSDVCSFQGKWKWKSVRPTTSRMAGYALPGWGLARTLQMVSVELACVQTPPTSPQVKSATWSERSLKGYILPTMHSRSQHCWELLHPIVHHVPPTRTQQLPTLLGVIESVLEVVGSILESMRQVKYRCVPFVIRLRSVGYRYYIS